MGSFVNFDLPLSHNSISKTAFNKECTDAKISRELNLHSTIKAILSFGSRTFGDYLLCHCLLPTSRLTKL